MKKETIYKIIGASILVIGGYIAYKKLQTKPTSTSLSDIDVIVNSGNSSSKEGLAKLGSDYVSVWATAVKNAQPVFLFNGKKYNTNGGTAVK